MLRVSDRTGWRSCQDRRLDGDHISRVIVRPLLKVDVFHVPVGFGGHAQFSLWLWTVVHYFRSPASYILRSILLWITE